MDRADYNAPTFVDDVDAHTTVMKSQRWRKLRSYLNKLLERGEGQLLWPITREEAERVVDEEKKLKYGDVLYHAARLAQAAGYNWGKSINLRKQRQRLITSALVFYDENGVDVDPEMAQKAIVIFETPYVTQILEESEIVENVEEPMMAG